MHQSLQLMQISVTEITDYSVHSTIYAFTDFCPILPQVEVQRNCNALAVRYTVLSSSALKNL